MPRKIKEEDKMPAMEEVITEIIKSAGVVVFGGAGFIITIKLLTALIALL